MADEKSILRIYARVLGESICGSLFSDKVLNAAEERPLDKFQYFFKDVLKKGEIDIEKLVWSRSKENIRLEINLAEYSIVANSIDIIKNNDKIFAIVIDCISLNSKTIDGLNKDDYKTVEKFTEGTKDKCRCAVFYNDIGEPVKCNLHFIGFEQVFDTSIISRHIFMFPFTWDTENGEISLKDFIDRIRSTINKNYKQVWKFKKLEQIKPEAEKDEYNHFVYFYDYVRDLLYSRKKAEDPQVMYDFRYLLEGDKKYIIGVEKSGKKINYCLDIDSIELKVYETEVGILIFNLINRKYTDKEHILLINDFGRRVYPQFMPLEDCKNNFLASSLTISAENISQIEEDFSETNTFEMGKKDEVYLSKTITELLWGEGKHKFGIRIIPVIDDRMYTLTYYANNQLSGIVSNDLMFKDDKLREFWSMLMQVDGSYSSCQNNKLELEMIKKQTYWRWQKNGTIFGISRYSFVVLVDEKSFSKNVLINHFKNMYRSIIIIALAQRASILRFSSRSASISGKMNGNPKHWEKEVKILQKDYIEFINKMWFTEVTAQEQGIELYDMVVSYMRLEKDAKFLDESIDELHRYANLETGEITNKRLNFLTILGTIATTLGTFIAILSVINEQQRIEFWNNIVGILKSIVRFIVS
ncbi:MAG: hypothetical protein ACOYWZ_01360 [Bacillota bacterium]